MAERLREIARRHKRYGYRRALALLRRDQLKVNHKRVHRLWKRIGLQCPVRRPHCPRHVIAAHSTVSKMRQIIQRRKHHRMRLAASRELPYHPENIAYLPGGQVMVLASSGEGAFVEAYNAQLAPMWATRLEERPLALMAADEGTLWVLDARGAVALGDGGVQLARVEVAVAEGSDIAAYVPLEDGVVFAWQHGINKSMRAPTLQRVSGDGTVRWSTKLPVGPIAFAGVVQMSREQNWKPHPLTPWKPRTWLSTSRTLTVSGDAVLACFSEMPRSGIGFGYVLSLSDGQLRFTTKVGPIQEVASLGGGAFLVGYQGYGAFQTLRYQPDGRVSEHWASHGYYVIRNDDVRVVEMQNVLPSTMHLVRLLPGGAVTKGAWLDGYYTSRPYLQADGTLYFFRNGTLVATRDLSIDERLVITPADDMLYSTKIVGGDRSLYFVYMRAGATADSPRLVRVDV